MASAVAISAARRGQTDRQHRADEERDADRYDDGDFDRTGSSRQGRQDTNPFAARQNADDSQQHTIARSMLASYLRQNPDLIRQVKDPYARRHLEEARDFTAKAKAVTQRNSATPDVNLPPTADDQDNDPDYALTNEQRSMVSRGGRMQAWREDMSPEEQRKLDLAIKGQLPRTAGPGGSAGNRKRRSSAADALLQASRNNADSAAGGSVLSQGALRSATAGSSSKSTRTVAESKVGPSGTRRYSRRYSMRSQGSKRPGADDDDPGVVQRGGQVMLGYDEQPCVIPQNHPFMRGWDVVMLALLVFTAVVTPFEVAFLASTEYDAMFFVNVVVSLLFLTDLVINFFLPYTDIKTGVEVDDNIDIAYNYLTGWFVLDFVSIFPFDVIAAETGGEETAGRLRIIRTIRLLKLAKLLRIVRANRIFTRWRNLIGLTYSMVQLLQFLVVIMVLAHWSACVFYLWSSLFMDDYDTSYIAEAGLVESKPWTSYLVSLYWATATISTIGYGDVNPVNTAERGMGVLLMLIGGGLYAYTVGAVYGLISTYDGATIEYRRMLDNLNMYTKEYKLPPDLKQDLRDYFGHCQKLMRAQFYRDLLRQMSPELRGRVASYLHKPWISHIPFFNVDKPSENKAFITAVAMNLEAAVFARKEHVVRQNETLTKMVIIQKGLATRWDTGQIVRRGAFFGEEMIMSRAYSHTTYQAVTFLDVYFLTKKSLQRILESGDFEKTRQKIRFAIIRLALRRELKLAMALIRMQNSMLGQQPGVANVPGATSAIARGGSNGSMDASGEKEGTDTTVGGAVAQISEMDSQSDAAGDARLVTSKSIRMAKEQQEEAAETTQMTNLTEILIHKGLVQRDFVEMKRRSSVAATNQLWKRNSKSGDDPERQEAKKRAREAAERHAKMNPDYQRLLDASTPSSGAGSGGFSPTRKSKRHGSMIVQTRDPLLPEQPHLQDIQAARARVRWMQENGEMEPDFTPPDSYEMPRGGRTILAKAKSHMAVPFAAQQAQGGRGHHRRRSGASRLVHKMNTAQEESREEDASPRKYETRQQRQAAVNQGSVLERGGAMGSESDDDVDSLVPGGIGQPVYRRQSPEPISLGLKKKYSHADRPVVPGRTVVRPQPVELPGTPAGVIAQGTPSSGLPQQHLRRVGTAQTAVHEFDAARDVGDAEDTPLKPLGGGGASTDAAAAREHHASIRSVRMRRKSAPGTSGTSQEVFKSAAKQEGEAASQGRSPARNGLRVVATGLPDSDSEGGSSQTPAGASVSVGGEVLDRSVSRRGLGSVSGKVDDAGSDLEAKGHSMSSRKGGAAPKPAELGYPTTASRPPVQPKPKGGRRMSRAGLIELDKQAALKRTHSVGQALGHGADDPADMKRAFNSIKRKMNPLAREMWRNQLIKKYGMNPDDASRVVEDPSQREVVVYTQEGRRVVFDPKQMGATGPVQGGFNPALASNMPAASMAAGRHSGQELTLMPRSSFHAPSGAAGHARAPSSGYAPSLPVSVDDRGVSGGIQLSPEVAERGVREQFSVGPIMDKLEGVSLMTKGMAERVRHLANANSELQVQNRKMDQQIQQALALVERNNLQMHQVLYRMWTGMIGMCVIAALIIAMVTASLVVVLNTAR